MNFKQLFPNLFLFTADNTEQLAKVFVRMQGYVDSTQFRGKVFSLPEYEQWFSNDGKSNLYTAFVGYNIPNYVITKFNDGSFKNISLDETWLLNNLAKINPKGLYYVIGYVKGHEATLKHELAHALYYLNNSYLYYSAQTANLYLQRVNHNNYNKIMQYFELLRYSDSIYVDEMQAYLVAAKTLQKLNIWDELTQNVCQNMNVLFDSYYFSTFHEKPETTINKQNFAL